MRRNFGSLILIVLLLLAATPSALATVHSYQAFMDGPSEATPNASPGTGFGTIVYDDAAHTLALNASFSGLTAGTTASHIHAPTATPFSGMAGVATTTPSFALFPLGVTSGTFSNVLNLTQSSSWNTSYVTANGGTTAGAESAFAAALAGGMAYWNIHTSTFPSGEIRGFAIPIPEPATCLLIAWGAAGLCFFPRRRQR
jgi:hypothetical protein